MRTFRRGPFLNTALLAKIAAPGLIVGLGLLIFISQAYGAQILLQRSVSVSTSQTSATAAYQLDFTTQSAESLGSIDLLFCSNSPIFSQACTAPTGLDAQSASLSAQSGTSDFVIKSPASSNEVVLQRTPGNVPPTTFAFTLSGITNPSNVGSYYLRVQTYATNDASGPTNDEGGLAFAMTNTISISAEVPPYLVFCSGIQIAGNDCSTVQGNYINFGDITSKSSASAQSQFAVTTNAQNGYTVFVSGTTLTSGNNVIPGLTFPDISRPGTSQFGINLRANSDPAVGSDVSGPGIGSPAPAYDTPNMFLFNSGDVIATGASASDTRKFTVSYLLNIASDQPAGVYASTLTYTGSGNF